MFVLADPVTITKPHARNPSVVNSDGNVDKVLNVKLGCIVMERVSYGRKQSTDCYVLLSKFEIDRNVFKLLNMSFHF